MILMFGKNSFSASICLPSSIEALARPKLPAATVEWRFSCRPVASLPIHHRSPSRRPSPCGPLCSAVRDARQIKSRVAHTCDGFSEPVAKPYGFVLRAVFVVNTWICVPQECLVDFAVHAS
jgi:hypothetical protein